MQANTWGQRQPSASSSDVELVCWKDNVKCNYARQCNCQVIHSWGRRFEVQPYVLPLRLIKKLQLLQNAWLLTGAGYLQRVAPLFWLSFLLIYHKHMCKLTHSCQLSPWQSWRCRFSCMKSYTAWDKDKCETVLPLTHPVDHCTLEVKASSKYHFTRKPVPHSLGIGPLVLWHLILSPWISDRQQVEIFSSLHLIDCCWPPWTR